MVDAPIQKRHREEAARSTFDGEPLPPWAQRWIEAGVGLSPLRVTLNHAQSLANLEARYAPVVSAARKSVRELHATGGDQNVLGWLESALKGLP